jgi:hypothetical protein
MLADDIAGRSGTPGDDLYRGAFGMLARQIAHAQRFDFAPEVMRSALTIAGSAIGPQLRALALCKLPFEQCWFEWPATFSGFASTRTDLRAPVPKRMGALVTVDASLQRGSIVYAWSHSKTDQTPEDALLDVGLVNICPLLVTFDWRPEGAEPVADITHSHARFMASGEAEWAALTAAFPRVAQSTRDDVIADQARFGLVINPLMRAFVDLAVEKDVHTQVLGAALKDIEGEAPMLRAAIMLLNSRNLATTEHKPAPAKLNKARAARGRAPLLDYTHVGIRLTRALAARAGGAADPRQPTRLHLVRGHFKLRAGKVFWWSPHARGVADTNNPITRQHRSVSL